MNVKELIEYLQGFPDDADVHINVIDTHMDKKYGFIWMCQTRNSELHMRNMSSKKVRKIWMEVTRDEYELPVRIADSVEELAEMCGTSTNTIRSNISHCEEGKAENLQI